MWSSLIEAGRPKDAVFASACCARCASFARLIPSLTCSESVFYFFVLVFVDPLEVFFASLDIGRSPFEHPRVPLFSGLSSRTLGLSASCCERHFSSILCDRSSVANGKALASSFAGLPNRRKAFIILVPHKGISCARLRA